MVKKFQKLCHVQFFFLMLTLTWATDIWKVKTRKSGGEFEKTPFAPCPLGRGSHANLTFLKYN